MARWLAFLLFFSAPAFAQVTVVRAGHLIDPATGTVSENQVILVEKGKIVEVGPQVALPAGAEVVDLSDAYVLPGLMDVHTHITMNVPPTPRGGPTWEGNWLTESTAFRALRGARNARLLLEAGFTTLRDVGNAGNYADTDVRLAIEKGWFAGPTILNTGKIIAAFGGQSHGYAPERGRFWRYEYIDADTPDEVRRAVRQNIYYGAKAIKLVADNSPFYYSREEIRAAVAEAHKAGLTVAVHAYGGEGARNAILAGADSIEHGFELTDELLQLMKEKGTVLVGTDFPYQHLQAIGGMLEEDPRRVSEEILDRLRRAHRVGVKTAFGSDVVADLPGRDRAQMALDYLAVWTAAGIPPGDILKAMTTNAAELLGIQDERGLIAPGHWADIIATPGNPLQDIEALRRIHFVMKEGKTVRRPAR